VPTPLAPPVQQFNCYHMVDSVTKGPWIGGSYDNISAVQVASAYYISHSLGMGGLSRSQLVGVFDNTNTVIAFIGEYNP